MLLVGGATGASGAMGAGAVVAGGTGVLVAAGAAAIAAGVFSGAPTGISQRWPGDP